jgi:hypothetical protein
MEAIKIESLASVYLRKPSIPLKEAKKYSPRARRMIKIINLMTASNINEHKLAFLSLTLIASLPMRLRM